MPRKKSFEPDEALGLMIEVFWEKGYAATSLSDLEAVTGLDRKSLYNAFGDKKKIFSLVLHRYLEEMGRTKGALLARDPKGRQNIRDFFLAMEYEPSCRGCLLTKTLNQRELVDPETFQFATEAILGLEKMLYVNLSADLGESTKTKRLAAFLTSSIQGITTMAKVDSDPKRLGAVVQTILAVLDGA